MNYSDFDKIEQDEWSLTRPTFPTPKGGTLTVVGFVIESKVKKYVIVCSKCEKDSELFGEGVFPVIKGNLLKGKIPCGCSKAPRLNSEQILTLCKREAEKRGVAFKSIDRDGLKFICPMHGEQTSLVSTFLKRGAGCKTCARDRTASINKVLRKGSVKRQCSDYDHLFPEGVVLKRQGVSQIWEYHCPLCKDDYISCAGGRKVFLTNAKKLISGNIPCRCSPSHRPTIEERMILIRRMIKTEKLPYTDLVLSGPKGTDFLTYSCLHHGVHHVTVDSFMHGYRRCPSCASPRTTEAYINIVDFSGGKCLKFGITSLLKRRIRNQNFRNSAKMQNKGVWVFRDAKTCRAAEKQCKKELECGILSKRELRDGYTETTHIKNLDKIIEIYENHGGKRISTDEER